MGEPSISEAEAAAAAADPGLIYGGGGMLMERSCDARNRASSSLLSRS